MHTLTVNYFAGIAQAAGVESERIECEQSAPEISAVINALTERHDADFARRLRVCALVANGKALNATDRLPLPAHLDVLPPFAGG
ncbi:MAG: MoaD/ThiS family protein [Arcanobacterium sp.]|nr:MoaD/ThiS family protein [Arcanobacterium sp.]